MNPKKIFRAVWDRTLELQEQMFRIFVLIAIMGQTAVIVVSAIAGKSIVYVASLCIVFVIFLMVVWLAIHYHKINIGAAVIGAITIYFLLPFNFMMTGGIYGGAPIWFLLGMVYVCFLVEGKIKYIFLMSDMLIFATCYYAAYRYPSLINQNTNLTAYTDSLIALLVVAVLTCSMILFQNAIYRSENETTQRQKKEIEELNKTQNRFFSSMSHEIRTPINTIIGLNEMILREDVSDEVAADAKSIQGAGKMLLTLINDILDMSKIESGKMDIVPVTYDVGAMLSDIVNMIWIRAKEKGLAFHIDVDQSTPAQLFGDEVRIKQVLINLLNNAVKYTREGSVTLSIQCKTVEQGLAQVSYSVADTGMGMRKESIPHLFSAFKRVDEEKNRYIEGTGLGLSIVKQLVELMGGEIAVNSVYTKGSTFVVTLPQEIACEDEIGELDLEARHATNEREHYKQSFEAPKAHILIVDDNETNRMVEEKLLRDTKVQVDTAASGAECLKKTLQNRYDVILMDHLMPEMDGIECLHAIRTQTGGLNQSIPIVILTANAGGENQELYRKEGFDGYLLKPVSGIQLETELLRHLPGELVHIMNATSSAGTIETPVLAHKKKTAVMISTDSVCDLPGHLLEKYQIAVMPYLVITEGGEFLDGVEAETDGVLSYISEQGKKVRSEAPAVADYEDFFANQLSRAQRIIHITMAQKVSKGYVNAVEASKTFDNVMVVDSGHLSSGMGLMVLCAAEYAAKGMTADLLLAKLKGMKQCVNTSFIVDSTEYLVRSGRISSKINTICKAFLLHPVLTLRNSSMKVGAIRIGTRNHAWKKYIASTFRTVRGIDTNTLFITHAGLTKEELKEIEKQVRNKVAFKNVLYQKASPAISTNCGPGTFGLLFMLQNER